MKVPTHLLLFFFATCLATGANASPTLPNIVIFMSDDMGWNDVGYHGGSADTPHIDSLARDGLELNRFYAYPICTPTRAALMTGRIPARFGLTGPLGGGGSGGLPTDETLMSDTLRAAGYQTALVGKWHLGSGEAYHPNQRGFDHFYGHLSGMIDYFAHTNKGTPDWQRNGTPLDEAGYSTDLIAKEAVAVIHNRDPEKPLFLYVPFNAPHGPSQAPDELTEKYVDRDLRGDIAVRAASIDSMDQAIGRVLAALDEQAIGENTLVLFFCDNGAKGGKRRNAVPETGLALSGGKGELYEGGIRVPAVMRWPAKIPAGSKSDTFVSVLDLFPSLTSAIGLQPESGKPLDGYDRWTALLANQKPADQPLLFAGQRGALACIAPPLKLMIKDGETELYDIVSDPIESRNLVEERPDDVARLQAFLEPLNNIGPRGKKGSPKSKKGKSRS